MEVRKYSRRKKDGSSYTRYGYDFYCETTGKRYRLTSCKTETQAKTAYKKILKEIETGEINKKLTFIALTESYINTHCNVHCSLATKNKYNSLYKVHIKPFFNDKKAINIKVEDINNFIVYLQGKDLSEKSINVAKGFVSSVFNYGIDNEMIVKNPCNKVKKLRIPHKEKNFLTEEQVTLLLKTCKNENPKFYPILYTAIFTGLRKGEICALSWEKIDFVAKKILVDKSMYKNNLQEPKTQQSIRKIDMIDSLAEVLKEYRSNSTLNKYVFWGEKGTPLSGDATLWRHFNKITSKCGLKDITFHDLRHTYASLLIAKNIPIKYIQRQMGHSTINMTLDTYGHLMPDVHDRAVEVLEEIARNNDKVSASSQPIAENSLLETIQV